MRSFSNIIKNTFLPRFINNRYIFVQSLLVLAALYGLASLFSDAPPEEVFWYYSYPPMPYYFTESVILSIILAKLRISWWITLLVLVSTLLQVHILFTTSISTNAPDIGGHLDYIRYLVTNSYMPPPPSGWQRQQPFLYYEWCALAFNVGKAVGLDPWFSVRIASRVLYLGYIISAILFIERFRFSTLAKLGLVSILLFWPSAYLISTRTNSDIGFIFFFMPALYWLQLWYEKLQHKHLGFAVICAALSLLCKATGVISFVTIAMVLAYALATRRITFTYFWNRTYIVPAIIVLLSLTGYFGRIGYYNWMYGAHLQWFANVHRGQVPYTPAKPFHFYYMHVQDFIMNPAFDGHTADHNFYTYWDGLFITLLYDIIIQTPLPLMAITNVLWLCIVALCIAQLLHMAMTPAAQKQYPVIIAALCALVIITMIQRGIIPDCRMFKGRRIYPLMPVIITLAMLTVQRYKEMKPRIYVLCCFLFITFSCVSTMILLYNKFT